MKPITQENSRLGFVGIGYMGRPIARRLLESGFKLTAYDRNHANAEELIPYGGNVAQSIAELSSSCDVVLSSLPSDEAVLDVYRGQGILTNTSRGSLLIDLSTVYPDISQQAVDAARSFQTLDSSQVAGLLTKTAQAAEAGQFELYKTTHQFDGTYANPQWPS